MKDRYVAYYRVSTNKQARSRLGLNAQKSSVDSFVERLGGDLHTEFEEAESGKSSNRPELQNAIDLCVLTDSILLIAKLDRLSRNVAFLANLMESGVKFMACDNPHANELTIHILAAVAQEERRAISERTKQALAQAKKRGVKLGNPRLAEARASRRSPKDLAKATYARQIKARERALKVAPHIKQAKSNGINTLSGIADYLNSYTRVKTTRGKEWTAMAVSRVLKQSVCD